MDATSAAQLTLLTTINSWTSIVGTFSTLILGVFAIVGGLLVWNGYQMKSEARKDLDEIRNMRLESLAIFSDFKKKADETVRRADKTIKQLTEERKKAGESTRAIQDQESKVNKLVSDWGYQKSAYSNASQGTATYFETPLPTNYPKQFTEQLAKSFSEKPGK